MSKHSLQAASLVFGMALACALLVVAAHWQDGRFEPDAKGDFISVEGPD